LFIVSFSKRESTFATLRSDINSPKPGLCHLTGQHNFQKGRAKVKEEIISGTIFLGTI